MPRSRSQIGVAAAALAAALVVGAGPARAADTFAWAPANAPCVQRGRAVARALGLGGLVELSVEVDNVFSDANRAALGEAERRLAGVRGVHRVIGPTNLLDVAVDADGQPTARAVLSRDADDARARVQRRADALGWFFSTNGRAARFYVEVEGDLGTAWPGLANALRASGLDLVPEPGADIAVARALWPDPRAHGARWLPAMLAGAWVLFLVVAGYKARPLTGRLSAGGAAGVAVAAMLGAAAPFWGVDVLGVRVTGATAAGAAAAALVVGVALERARAAKPGRWNRFAHPPAAVQALALAAVAALAWFSPQLRVGTHQWSEAPMLFVDVRADFDQPVVLREVQRLTEALRLQPGVAAAWSPADLFSTVDVEGEPARRVPADAADVKRVFAQARFDSALALELAPDHHEGLVVVRFEDGAPGIPGRLAIVDRVEAWARTELRRTLGVIDLRDAAVKPEARVVAKGLLASDTSARVARLCAFAGRQLTPGETLAVERAARQTAALPVADPASSPRRRARSSPVTRCGCAPPSKSASSPRSPRCRSSPTTPRVRSTCAASSRRRSAIASRARCSPTRRRSGAGVSRPCGAGTRRASTSRRCSRRRACPPTACSRTP